MGYIGRQILESQCLRCVCVRCFVDMRRATRFDWILQSTRVSVLDLSRQESPHAMHLQVRRMF
jgi:hypothetical protein